MILTSFFFPFNDSQTVLSVRVLETRNIVGNQIFPDSSSEQWQVSGDSIELPRGALIENSEGGLVRLVFVAFDRLEAILKPLEILPTMEQRQYDNSGIGSNGTYFANGLFIAVLIRKLLDLFTVASENAGSRENVNRSQSQESKPTRARILNSKVISASLGKGRHIQLSQPIRLVLKHLMVENVTNPTCVFWNYIDQ